MQRTTSFSAYKAYRSFDLWDMPVGTFNGVCRALFYDSALVWARCKVTDIDVWPSSRYEALLTICLQANGVNRDDIDKGVWLEIGEENLVARQALIFVAFVFGFEVELLAESDTIKVSMNHDSFLEIGCVRSKLALYDEIVESIERVVSARLLASQCGSSGKF